MTDEPRLDEPRLASQLAFLLEADRLKQVERRTTVVGGERRENSAEHSWHLALFALVLAEYADESVDLPRVLTMLLLHDLVEVDAGDTFIYDEVGLASKSEREAAAATRLFGRLDIRITSLDLESHVITGDSRRPRIPEAIPVGHVVRR